MTKQTENCLDTYDAHDWTKLPTTKQNLKCLDIWLHNSKPYFDLCTCACLRRYYFLFLSVLDEDGPMSNCYLWFAKCCRVPHNGLEMIGSSAAFFVWLHVSIYIYIYIYTSIDARLWSASLLWRVVDGVSAKVLWRQCFIESSSNVSYLGNWSKIMPMATMC